MLFAMSGDRMGILRRFATSKSPAPRILRNASEFHVIPEAANWLNVAGMVCSVSLLISYLVLPAKQTSRHYLNVGLVLAISLMQVSSRISRPTLGVADRVQLGFIVPLGAQPEQCHDDITPNDMYSDLTCAFSGAFLLFGGFCCIMWGTTTNRQRIGPG